MRLLFMYIFALASLVQSSWAFDIGPDQGRRDTLSAIGDTLDLKAVEVFTVPVEKYAYGQSLIQVSERDLERFQGQAFTEYLQKQTGLFLRQHGPGMLASLTMRGTSAGHNAVFWNGLPINSPSLGQTDFSILPVGGFDRAEILLGSGGALFGTDAIGGSVHLHTRLKFNQGFQAQVQSNVGSFGLWNQSVQAGFSAEKWSSRTQVYRNFSRNDFPFRNLSKFGTPVERHEHGTVRQYGFVQDLAWRPTDRSQLSTSIWYNDSDREIIPLIGSNTRDQQQDRNLRWVMDYFYFGRKNTLNLKGGLVSDELVFNVGSVNKTRQYFLSGDVEWDILPNIQAKSGIRQTFIQGNLSTYEAEESRTELYHSSNFSFRNNLLVSLNLRQLIYDGNFAPFTPSLGAEWEFFQDQKQSMGLKTMLARSFKVPTLNDRFWVPGGNPELLPEESYSAELGLVHEWKKGNLSVNQSLTYFQMWVDNWIIWLPRGNFWSPENIRSVNNSGLEYNLNAQVRLSSVKLDFSGNYAFNKAINQTDIDGNDRSFGKQLPYTPVHKAQGQVGASKDIWSAFINHQWVGERFVATDNIASVAAYSLWDTGIRMEFPERFIVKGQAGFQVNNLLNTEYQILRLRTMPGRNYQLNITIRL
ncbi:TonB-dependent receptor [Mongoliibacter sp.]|uniref:TonB-dependent receptor n=1 Tax=Mongoliibacter sp. TaxID=2022438 RepID=UPI0025EF9CC2|nr:TonB-dependent receptor plug domain-containing protein [Mongoliibacter sp.]